MQPHYRSSAILIACLLVPFGVAIYEDANADGPLGVDSLDAMFQDQVFGDDPYAYDYDDADALAEYAEYQRTQNDVNAYGELLNEYDSLDAYQPPRSMSVSFFDATFFAGGKAKTPTLSGPFAGLAFGQLRAEVQTLHPDAGDWPLTLPDDPDATASFEFARDRLASITVRFPDDGSALRSFTAQWGAPSTADGISGTALWHDTKSKLQAQLISSSYDHYASVTLRPYQELADFIAPGAPLFGFEDKDLLSLSAADIAALRSSSDYDDQIILRQPHFVDSRAPVEVILIVDAERVSSVTVNLDFDPASGKKLYQLLEDKLGRPRTKGGDEWGQFYKFKKGARIITLNTDGHGWNSINIARK